MTINPARILGINKGTLKIGADADITIIDPEARWTVDPTKFRSKSRNTPFAGWKLQGRADTVIVGGRVKYQAESDDADIRSRRPVVRVERREHWFVAATVCGTALTSPNRVSVSQQRRKSRKMIPAESE